MGCICSEEVDHVVALQSPAGTDIWYCYAVKQTAQMAYNTEKLTTGLSIKQIQEEEKKLRNMGWIDDIQSAHNVTRLVRLHLYTKI